MHIQYNESTFGHTGNISGPPSPLRPHNTKLTFDTDCGPDVQNPTQALR